MERPAGFVRRNGELRLQKDVASVEAFIHVNDGDSRLNIACSDYGLDGSGAAILRKERRVQVQAADARNLEHAPREDLSVGHHHDHLRRERADLHYGLAVAQLRRLKDRHR
jgi:hypothetical protein